MIQLIKLKNTLFEAAKVQIFQILSNFAAEKRTRSLMDKIKDSGSFALGSIPSGFTKDVGLPCFGGPTIVFPFQILSHQ